MRRFALHTAAAGLAMASAPALAQDVSPLSGFYIGAFGGVGFLGEQDVDTDSLIIGLPFESDTNIDYDPGFRFGALAGYQVDTNIRVQLDISYMSVDADNTLDIGGNDIDSEQETSILSGTAGIFLDLWPISITVPYVGAGVGIAHIDVDNDSANDLGDDTQTVLTAFAEAGVPFNITPDISIAPSLRFSWYNTKEETDNIVVLAGVTEAEIASIGENLYETQLLLSARYNF